ncbi:hypothetical protein BDV25DRAFT_126700 [Aspergillus avenaceus]|uniref:S-adenosyl-L-methionine-dependent methyltransferase n=1 Tax=Aspergillus avenaceus TaxID=36643 RepID=A0A5N6U6J9_ASPAV|nr:hypothetical protein BDV25DRAFT_126700 [Aspergillus avenaceus]
MTNDPDYIFSRNYLDNNRINLQHYLVVQLFGYHIHPSIPITPETRIADIGTGTGIWLTDLADKLPKTIRLDGLDISLDAAPLPSMLPENMSLRTWDIKTAVPEDLVGVYDIVNVRFFAFVVQDDEMEGVILNLEKLLKPGGHIQWTDIDIGSVRLEKTHPDTPADNQMKLLNLFKGSDTRLQPSWVPRLPGLFATCGLAEIVTDRRDAAPYLALPMHECGLLATEVMTRSREGGDEAFRRTLGAAAKETRDGSWLAMTRYTVVGRRGLERISHI